ncbi:MAG: MFS transporter [Phycisphaerales bacterium]|nr:MAG: MFS transporter [Phycisphaerales bacterium]
MLRRRPYPHTPTMLNLNPFQNLPNPKPVWAWGMYDLANQSFTLLIITLLFPVYFREVIVGDPQRGDAIWGATHAASMLIVVILSPVLGALADVRGQRKRFLITTGLACSALTAGLAFADQGLVLLAIVLYIPANVLYQLGENFLASFLPAVSTPRNIGRVSAIGWTMGYVGALLLLIITAIMMVVFGIGDPVKWSPFFVLAGVWFLVNMTPAMVVLEEPPAVRAPATIGVARATYLRMRETVVSASLYRQFVRFLIAFFVFGMGVQTVIAFASIIATDFGFEQRELVLFVLQLTVTAGIAAAITSRFQDRIGAKATVMIYLGVWIASSLGLFGIALSHSVNPETPKWLFWVVGNGIGFGLGGIGTAARSLVGRFTPVHKTAEFFGLWGMVYRLAAVVGVTTFSQSKAWVSTPVALALLTGFFVVGLLLVLRVNESAGVRAAQRSQRDAARLAAKG